MDNFFVVHVFLLLNYYNSIMQQTTQVGRSWGTVIESSLSKIIQLLKPGVGVMSLVMDGGFQKLFDFFK